MNGDIKVTGGSLTGIGGTADVSVGVYVNNDGYSLTVSGTGSVTGTGGEVTDSQGLGSASYGVKTSGNGTVSVSDSGTLNATGGTATGGNSYGIDPTSTGRITLSGGTTTAKGHTQALSKAPTLTNITGVGSANYNGIPAVTYVPANNDTYKYFAAPGTPTPIALTGLTLSTNTPKVGTAITATVAPEGATVDYKWYTNNSASTENGSPIITAIGASYTPQVGDVGRYIYCVATGTGGYSGTASAVTAGAVAKAPVTPPAPVYNHDTVYNTIKGADGTWTQGGADGYSFTFNAPLDRFKSLLMDGVTVAAGNYDKREDSTVITLHADYLATLSVGTHTLRAIFSDGYAQTTFTIAAAVNPFADVAESDWFYEDVMYAFGNGMMKGTDDDTFDPQGAVTRGMIVEILYRMAEEPAVTGKCPFDDVASGMYYENAITWAAENNIVSGMGGGKFAPEAPITREQMAAMLYRCEQFKGGGFTGSWMFRLDFTDGEVVSEWAYEAMCWCTTNGIINGVGGGRLAPQDGAQRCQAAAILHRFIER